jgi:hypothetical protein
MGGFSENLNGLKVKKGREEVEETLNHFKALWLLYVPLLPTQCIYVFCVDLRTTSDYFTVQH